MTRRDRRKAKKLQATNAALRERIKLLEEELEIASTPAQGELVVFLSGHHIDLLVELYNAQALSFGLNPAFWRTNPDFEEAWDEFVEAAIEIAYDGYKMEKEWRKRERAENFFRHN
jgi:hypothetical protein